MTRPASTLAEHPGAVPRVPARRRAPTTPTVLPWLRPGLLLGGLAPLMSILARATSDGLGANPIAKAENELGLAALIFLVAGLACTPARRLFGWSWPPRVRRDLGLLAFGYAVLHVLLYLGLDQVLDWDAILADAVKRPFITAGVAALGLLIPLALTSTNASVRRLGFRRWQRLHQLAYLAGLLAVVHFIWRVKLDVSQPLTYAIVLGVLLVVRLGFWLRTR